MRISTSGVAISARLGCLQHDGIYLIYTGIQSDWNFLIEYGFHVGLRDACTLLLGVPARTYKLGVLARPRWYLHALAGACTPLLVPAPQL